MSVKIRLQRHGRSKAPFYHIVVADARAPRDGRFIEKLGTYNPLTKPATIDIDREKAFDWIMKGAQPTDTVRAMLRLKGVMFKKHLQRGVAKGAMTQEQADAKWNEWVNAKEAKLSARAEATAKEIADFHATVAGTNYVPKKKEEPVVEEAPAEAAAEATEPVEAEAPAEEETPAAEAPAEEAPAAEEETPAAEESTEEEKTEE